MRRALKNMLVLVAAIVMMLSMSITAFASSATPKLNVVKSITIKDVSTDKKVSKDTLYVNGAEAAVDELYFGRNSEVDGEYTKSATPTTKTYKLAIGGKDSKKPVDVCVLDYTNSNSKAVEVVLDAKNNELTVKAIGVGTAKVKVYDKGTKKSATITVTAKGLVDSIEFNAAKEVDEFSNEEYIHMEQKGKVNVAAAVNANASKKNLKYVVTDHQILVDGKWQDSLNSKNQVVAVAKVDSKGNVTANVEKRSGIEMAKANVYVYAQDQSEFYHYKDSKGRDKTKKYTSGVYAVIPVYIYPATYQSNDIIKITNLDLKKANAKPGKNNTYKDQVLYTNESDAAHTMQIVAAAYTGTKEGKKVTYTKDNTKKVVYTTSNAKVATVSADGVITAVGNGSATISAVPAYGFTSPKATVKVNVKTKASAITLKNENLTVFVTKSVSAGASIKDKKVSNKKLTYSVLSGKDVVSVDSKGKIKGLKEGFATVKVTSADGFTSKNIKVEVLEPVSKVAFYDEKGNKITKATIYEYDDWSFDNAGIECPDVPTSVKLNAVGTSTRKIGKDAAGKSIYATPTYPNSFNYNSSNWRVVDVYGDEAVANGKGSAKITATAADTSKKKATLNVNVIKLVDEINIAKADVWYEDGKKQAHMYVEKGTKATIKATTNADANNKKLNKPQAMDVMSISGNAVLKDWSIEIKDTCTAEQIPLLIEAQDKVKIGVNPDGTAKYTKPYAVELIIHVVDNGAIADYAKAGDVSLYISDWYTDELVQVRSECEYANDEGHYCDEWCGDLVSIVAKKGTTFGVGTSFNSLVKDKTIKWSVSGNGISVKNGVVTAKKVNANNEVIATYKTGKNTTASVALPISVVKSDADYQAEMNNRVKAKLADFKGEGLGLSYGSTKYDAWIYASVEDPNLLINDQKDTGIVTILESIVDPDVCSLIIEGWVPNIRYELVRNNGMIDIWKYKGDEYSEIAAVDELDTEALATVLKDQLILEGYETYADMNGVEGYITVNSLIKDANGDYVNGMVNSAYFYVYFYMTDAKYDDMIDGRIANELAALNESGVLATAGIESIGYDAATNTALVNIEDGTVTLDTADSIRANVANALKTVFEGAGYADVAVEACGEYKEKSFSETEKELDVAIDELFDEVLEMCAEKEITEIGMFDGGLATAKVTFPCGTDEYVYDYAVKFERTVAAVDAQMDKRIQAGIDAVDSKDSGLTAAYDAEANTVTIKVEKTDYSVMNLQSTGLFAAIEDALKGVAVGGKEITASIAVGDLKTDIADLTKVTKADLEKAFGVETDITLVDLMDNNAAITVVYPQLSGDVKLTYQVVYELDMDKIDAAIDEAIADAAAEATESTGIIDEIIYDGENHKASISFNGIEVSMDDISAVKSIVKAATPVDFNGITAESATVVYGDYRKTVTADEVNEFVIEDFIRGAFGIADTEPVTADKIAGNSLTLKVVYSSGNEEFFIMYTVEFMELSLDSEDDPIKDTDVVFEEVEETVEETEEVTEEVEETVEETEEVTEEVEETVEETEEVTEEVEETVEETEETTEEVTE